MAPPLVPRLVGLIRDGWHVLGIAILMLLCAELAYRGQAAARQALRSDPEAERPPHPYDGESWWTEWQNGGARWEMRFDPYRALWARPGTSKFITIDSEGRRITIDPAPSVPKTAKVYMFGGSAMFGYTARDAFTIPTLIAEELKHRGRPDVQVLNFAQSTFNLTQEVNTLVLELRARRVPTVAVFMDGNNEVAPPFQSGRVGSILNEDQLASRLVGPGRGLTDLIMSHLVLAQRLARIVQKPVEPFVGDAKLCPEIAQQYFALMDVAKGLGHEFGFQTIYFWQPMNATTGKSRTAWEQSISSAPRWRETVAACTKVVDDVARARNVSDFHPLHHLFDEDKESIFLDDYGHIVESGNRKVAGAIVDRFIDRLPPAALN